MWGAAPPKKMRHTFVVHVEDKPGVLNRVASLFRRRAFNIESLTVGHTETDGVSRMTIVVNTDVNGARRIEANLYKLVNVLRVTDLTSQAAVIRDLTLIRVAATIASIGLRPHVTMSLSSVCVVQATLVPESVPMPMRIPAS
mgnify:CR=1 FL=1